MTFEQEREAYGWSPSRYLRDAQWLMSLDAARNRALQFREPFHLYVLEHLSELGPNA